MNHVYQLIWNDLTATYVATPERTKSRGKRSRAARALAVAATLGAFTQAHAAPSGGQISAGSGNINQSGAVTTITQGSQKLSINWNSFGVAANETVNFVQPNSSAIALNRVLGTDGSQILGKLNANGQVFIINPNGVLFGSGSQVNVGGLVASTLHLSDTDFLAGKYTFSGSGGSVINQGQITAADGGYVALIGNQVSNQGTIIAKLGTVALAAGNQVMLDFAGDGLLSLTVDQSAVNALVTNKGLIRADGGYALMTAHAKDALLNTVVNNEGIIQARTVENHNGVIRLLGNMDSGTVKVDGTLDASAPNGGDGGFIDTSGAHVVIDPSVKVTTLAAKGKTGTWLIDPNDYTIAASGGDITGTLLSSQLGSNNILILSSAGATAGNGDIFVNDAVSWAANTTLTLSAYRNIEVNADITATGNTAGLTLTPGTGTTGDYNLNNGAKITLPGSAPSLTIAGHVYTVINDVNTLQAMNANVAGYYALGSDIDASVTSGWNGGLGFVPVGRYPSPFVGTLDGANHQILNLVINRPAEPSILGVGLFGYVVGGWVQNLEMVGGNITGSGVVGAIAGSNQGNGLILNVRSSATITGISSEIGGIVGNNQGRIAGSYTTGAVVGGNDQIGGLVGANYGTVLRSFATGSISGRGSTGGLVGSNAPGGSISDSYATGSVTGTFNGNVWGEGIGGLAGTNSNGTIANAYSTGFVTFNAGYSGSGYGIGGLVGAVNTNAGGGTTTNSYWDTQTSGQTASAGGAARSTAQMKQQATFVGWDFQNIWSIQAGAYPQLRPVTSGNHLTPPPTTTNPVVPGAPEHGYDGAVDSAHGGNSNHHGEDNNGRHKGNAYAFGKSKHKDRDERSGNDERDEDLPRNFEQGSKMQLSGLPIALEGSGVHLPVVAEKRGE